MNQKGLKFVLLSYFPNFYGERSWPGFAQDYPAARVRLEAIAAKKLEKYKKVPLEKGLYVYLKSQFNNLTFH